jgi:hypothetical protein
MNNATRSLIAVAALVVLIGVPVAIWSGTSKSDEPDEVRTDLVLERYLDPATLKPEIVAYLPEHGLNRRSAVPDGRVRLKCVDTAGKTVVSTQEKWPLTTDLGGTLPHAHRPVRQEVLDSIRRCSLTGGHVRISGSRFRR